MAEAEDGAAANPTDGGQDPALDPVADPLASAEHESGGNGEERGDRGGESGASRRIQELVRRNKALQSQLDAQGMSDNEESSSALSNPPEGMSPEQKVDWLMQQTLRRHGPQLLRKLLKEELGFDPKQAASIMQGLQQHVQQSVVERFETSCQKHGLDPKDKDLRSLVASHIRSTGATPEKALDTIVRLSGRKATPAVPASAAEVADMLVSGLTGVTAVEDADPRTFEEANALARQGKAVRQKSVVDILARKAK